MQVIFKSRDPQAAALQADVERRVRFVLRRISGRVPRAEIVMSDVNGPRGGIDKRCQVELRAIGHRPVVVSSVSKDWRTALDKALSRVSRHLLHLWQRLRASRRSRFAPVEPQG